jgi:hypothetical protein
VKRLQSATQRAASAPSSSSSAPSPSLSLNADAVHQPPRLKAVSNAIIACKLFLLSKRDAVASRSMAARALQKGGEQALVRAVSVAAAAAAADQQQQQHQQHFILVITGNSAALLGLLSLPLFIRRLCPITPNPS